MKNKSIIISVLSALLLVVVFVTLPFGATAQMATYYNGYNAAPRWAVIGNQTVVQGQTVSVSAIAHDDNGDPLTYSTAQLPANSSFNPLTRVFSFTPNYGQLGSFAVTLGVTDNKSATVYATFYVNVTTDYGHSQYGGGSAEGYYNQAPYFSATNSHYAISSGTNLRFTINAIDPENQSIRYSISNLPSGAGFDSVTRAFNWTPERNQRGTYSLAFYASDGYATGIPLNVTIVVDGGSNSGMIQQINAPIIGTAAQYYPNYSGVNCDMNVPPSTALAGQVYVYSVRACNTYGASASYQLTLGPIGSTLNSQTGLLTWTVPKNAVNKEYQFAISTSNGYLTSAVQNFNVRVEGGVPEVSTIVTAPKTIVRYVNAPVVDSSVTSAQSGATIYYPNGSQNIYVNTGRTVPPTNYGYYSAGAYGTFLPSQVTPINVFNISVRVNNVKEMLVGWDTNIPTTGEVVFGYASQSRGSDLNRMILNYDFTTGLIEGGASTRHEVSLGKLDTNRTYYLRVISRSPSVSSLNYADNQTEISREIVFIPMATQEGSIIIEQTEGAASAAGTLGAFITSGGFLLFLVLVIIGLIVYLFILGGRKPSIAAHSVQAPDHLTFYPEEHR